MYPYITWLWKIMWYYFILGHVVDKFSVWFGMNILTSIIHITSTFPLIYIIEYACYWMAWQTLASFIVNRTMKYIFIIQTLFQRYLVPSIIIINIFIIRQVSLPAQYFEVNMNLKIWKIFLPGFSKIFIYSNDFPFSDFWVLFLTLYYTIKTKWTFTNTYHKYDSFQIQVSL